MSEIFVYHVARDQVILVHGTSEEQEEFVSSLADGVMDQAIYFFAEISEEIGEEWQPTRWRRALTPDGRVYAESSDEEEIREAAAEVGTTPQRLFERTVTDLDWRDI